MPRNDRSAAARADAAEPWVPGRKPAVGLAPLVTPGPEVDPVLEDGAGYIA